MNDVNMHDQENKYNSLRQGEREFISNFKIRFDEQVSANDRVGVAAITESRKALDLDMKLDPKRYKKMHDEMKNDALRCVADAYPKTLAAAYRIASQWTGSDHNPHAGTAAKPAVFVTDGALVATKDPKDPEKAPGKTGCVRKKTTLTDITCHVCGHTGHYARNCSERKSSSYKTHLTTIDEDDVDSDGYDVALITTAQTCLFNLGSNFDVTARDFQIADAIWGADIASLKGKTTKRATTVADITVNAKIVQQDQVLAIDIMFIEKTATLIGVATPLGLIIAYSLNRLEINKGARAAINNKKGIDHFVTTLASQNFKTKMIISDGERGVTS